jgi:hypothetical protein
VADLLDLAAERGGLLGNEFLHLVDHVWFLAGSAAASQHCCSAQ